jgi:hypothetical protein
MLLSPLPGGTPEHESIALGFGMTLCVVMAELVPAIHVFYQTRRKDVDARDMRGHDDST